MLKLTPKFVLNNVSLIIGSFLLIIAIINYLRGVKRTKNYYQTIATVIDNIAIQNYDDETSFKPLLKVIDKDGVLRKFESNESNSPAKYKLGDKVEILHDESYTDIVIISFWSLYRKVIISLVLASPFLTLGLLKLVFELNKN